MEVVVVEETSKPWTFVRYLRVRTAMSVSPLLPDVALSALKRRMAGITACPLSPFPIRKEVNRHLTEHSSEHPPKNYEFVSLVKIHF